MLRLAVPAGLQQLFFATGMTAFFVIVGQVGTAELAASNVLLNLLLVAILPGMGFGLAAATLVGQALGADDREGATLWGWDVVKMAMIVLSVLAPPAVIFPEWLLYPFLFRSPDTLAMATEPLRLIAILLPFEAIGMVLLNSLLGAGDSKKVMIISIALQWGLQIPLIYLVGPWAGMGLFAIWAAQSGVRALQSVLFSLVWRGPSWGHQRI